MISNVHKNAWVKANGWPENHMLGWNM